MASYTATVSVPTGGNYNTIIIMQEIGNLKEQLDTQNTSVRLHTVYVLIDFWFLKTLCRSFVNWRES